MNIVRACSYADMWFALAISMLVGVLLSVNGAPVWAALGAGMVVQTVLIVGGAITGAINERGEQ